MTQRKTIRFAPPCEPRPGLVEEYRSGTGKVIKVGDTVWQDGHSKTYYKVTEIREVNGTTEVTCYGGKRNLAKTRTFLVETLHRKLQKGET